MYIKILFSFLLIVQVALSFSIRTGNHPDKLRVVFDAGSKVSFSYMPFWDLNMIIFSVDKNIPDINEKIFNHPKIKRYIKDVDIIRSKKDTKFVIEFDKSIQGIQIFTLKKPYRIVIDFLKKKKSKSNIYKKQKTKYIDIATVDEADRFIRRIIENSNRRKEERVNIFRSISKIERKPVYNSRKKIIVIDPGHGGRDPGAVANGLKEKDVNLKIAKILKKVLEKDGRFKVYLTRNRDKFVSLYRRTLFTIEKRADLFISIHCNSSPSRRGYGTYVYTLNLRGARSKLARMVEQRENRVVINYVKVSANPYVNKIVADLAISNTMTNGLIFAKHLRKYLGKVYTFRKIDSANFAVLKTPGIPSVLIETAYITNKREAKLLKDPAFLKKISISIYKAIVDYFFKGR